MKGAFIIILFSFLSSAIHHLHSAHLHTEETSYKIKGTKINTWMAKHFISTTETPILQLKRAAARSLQSFCKTIEKKNSLPASSILFILPTLILDALPHFPFMNQINFNLENVNKKVFKICYTLCIPTKFKKVTEILSSYEGSEGRSERNKAWTHQMSKFQAMEITVLQPIRKGEGSCW